MVGKHRQPVGRVCNATVEIRDGALLHRPVKWRCDEHGRGAGNTRRPHLVDRVGEGVRGDSDEHGHLPAGGAHDGIDRLSPFACRQRSHLTG